MLKILDVKECCGCGSCSQGCPVKCISMEKDREGFLYPSINVEKCIECGICVRTCPMLTLQKEKKEEIAYSAYAKDDDIRKNSSSGGIFTILAVSVIKMGGVVFGARFDENWNVVHDFTEEIDGLSGFRGSKYLQSEIGNNYKKAKDFLLQGRKVLFSGTPCQIAGLHAYLRKRYENLITVDFVCHGVPSPGVWQKYLKSLQRTQCASGGKNSEFLFLKELSLGGISFRNKRFGWKKYGILLEKSSLQDDKNTDFSLYVKKEWFQPFQENRYMDVFLSNLSLRPSCYACRHKNFSSGSDITLGDFWGIDKIDPAIDDDKGISLLFIHNPAILQILDGCNIFIKPQQFQDAVRFNLSIRDSVVEPPYRRFFFNKLNAFGDFDKAYVAVKSPAILNKVRRRWWRLWQ